MSHPFGDLVSQHLHRKHGLSQSKLAAGILQDPSIVGKMCQGERLTGPQARERVLMIIDWLCQQDVLETVTEANDLLVAAGMSPLQEGAQAERTVLRQLRSQPRTDRGPTGGPIGGSVRSPVTFARGTNLPTPLTSFVGRTHELAEVAQSTMDHRLVTLTGAGGVGKTRIAIEVARRMFERDQSHHPTFPDGVWFVALGAVDSPERMVSTIADAVQCPPPPMCVIICFRICKPDTCSLCWTTSSICATGPIY
jgi:hypothetical protein